MASVGTQVPTDTEDRHIFRVREGPVQRLAQKAGDHTACSQTGVNGRLTEVPMGMYSNGCY